MEDNNFYEEEDLVVAGGNDRNWKGIIIAVLVITSVLALIVTSVVLLTPPDEGPRVKGRRFELEDIFGQEFQPYRTNGTWISDDEWVFRDQFGGASIMNMTSLTTHSLISNITFGMYKAVSFSLSANRKYALFLHDKKKIHRFSFLANYTVYDIENRNAQPLNLGGDTMRKYSALQLVKWSPLGNALVLVYEGDIYYKMNVSEMTMPFQRITTTAQNGVIYNGVPDWLYEEEILESNSALWFSSDGVSLLYLTFNDSLVGEHHILQYGDMDGNFAYPQVKTLRYPKPGTNNPIVNATVCDLKKVIVEKNRCKNIQPPQEILNQDHYITSAGWINEKFVGIVWTTRTYNLSIITMCSVRNGTCEEQYRISPEKRGWVDNIPFPHFTMSSTTTTTTTTTTSSSTKNFTTIAPIRDGENGFFDHLLLVDMTNKLSYPITHGSFDVIRINAWDEERKFIYFMAIPASHPNERRLYRIRVEPPYRENDAECLSCSFTKEKYTNIEFSKYTTTGTEETVAERGDYINMDASIDVVNPALSTSETNQQLLFDGSNKSCSFVTNARFSLGKTYFVLECGGPDIPYTALYSVDLSPDSELRLIQILQNNDALRNTSSRMAFPQIRTFPVHLNSGSTAQIRLLLPPGLREDEITQYPLILNVYGAPGSQLAVDRWGVDFATYLASKKDFIVAQVDSRGSGGKGWTFKHQVYYNLGQNEAQDQIEVVKYLRDSLAYVESNKVGIWGWSYGGFLTASIMTNKDTAKLFQCGASIAPVTKWNLYDSAYSERYMGTPTVADNLKGYTRSDVTKNVENLTSKMFYLIHGTADDNVHIQHSMLLAKALVDKKILFRQQIYPDENHNLNGAKIHVHRSLEEFFDDCFRKQIPPELGIGLNKGGKFEDFD